MYGSNGPSLYRLWKSEVGSALIWEDFPAFPDSDLDPDQVLLGIPSFVSFFAGAGGFCRDSTVVCKILGVSDRGSNILSGLITKLFGGRRTGCKFVWILFPRGCFTSSICCGFSRNRLGHIWCLFALWRGIVCLISGHEKVGSLIRIKLIQVVNFGLIGFSWVVTGVPWFYLHHLRNLLFAQEYFVQTF